MSSSVPKRDILYECSTLTVSQTKSPSCLAAVLFSALVAGAFKDTTVSVVTASYDLLIEARAAVIDQTHIWSSVMPIGIKG